MRYYNICIDLLLILAVTVAMISIHRTCGEDFIVNKTERKLWRQFRKSMKSWGWKLQYSDNPFWIDKDGNRIVERRFNGTIQYIGLERDDSHIAPLKECKITSKGELVTPYWRYKIGE